MEEQMKNYIFMVFLQTYYEKEGEELEIVIKATYSKQ